MRFAVFFSILLLLIGSLCVYVHRRASDMLRLSRRGRIGLACFLAGGVLAILVSRTLRAALGDTALRILGSVGMTLTLAVILSSVLLGAIDFARLLTFIFVRAYRFVRASRPSPGLVAASEEAAARSATARARAPGVPSAPSPAPRTPESASSLLALKTALPGSGAGGAGARPLAPHEGASEGAAPCLPAAAAPVIDRRAFLSQAATASAFLIGGGSALYGTLAGRHDYVIEEVAVPVPGLPKSLDGFTIAQISDIHIGLFVGEPELLAAEDLFRKVRPDLIVMTGDLIDSDARFAGTLGRFTRRIAALSREGVAAIPGNHDYFAGIDETLSTLRAAGATVLRNSGRVLGGAGGAFALLGVDDVWAGRENRGGGPDMERTLQTVPRDLARVLLCHNPVYFPEAARDVALQLSGHTHGGQVNLLLRPADLVLPHGYVADLYRRDNAQLYINRGFGTAGPPARVGAPPEVTKVVLISA